MNELSYRERGLLARLTRNVSTQDITQSVRIAVETLAAALQTSGKTVQRTFTSLQQKGWITRSQVQKRSGMQIADTWLTKKSLEVLGFLAPSRAASDNMSDASRLSPMSEDSQQIPGLSVPEAKESPLPEDVQLLERMGLRRGAIFKLMGEATKAGHRLGNIVRAAAPLIKEAKHPFGYMRKLIATSRDWATYTCAALRRQQEAAEAVVEMETSRFQQDEVRSAMANGVMLTNAAGRTVWMLRYDYVFACPVEDLEKSDTRRRYACVTDLGSMSEALRAGKLFPYQYAM